MVSIYYKCHKIKFKRGGLYTDSPNWIINKKASMNPKNKDDGCFQYATTIALNFDEIKNDQRRVSNIKPFVNKYNWDGIKCL